ncbi:MAG TPA: M14 metallopeptidase family protein [Bryobacteraceae bacterium]|nr:M14 metallopeptidase family protein [Bryobacteraceae bacterium]
MKRWAALAFAAATLLAEVPVPEKHFGHRMGADRKLLDWDKVVGYFRSLEQSSDRLRLEELGKTVDGRPLIAAFISTPETIRTLGRYREIQASLADPRRTTATEAAKLFADGKTVVMITCSIHATEVASTASAIELAYRLLTDDQSKFRTILSNTILILVPSLNPDGVDIVTQWYRKTLGSRFEGTSPPELYHRYVGHDNNRDWYIFSQPETRLTVAKLHNVWHPQIVYDVHQQGPHGSRMFVPPWLDPIDPNVDPIIAQLSNAIGTGMAYDLTAAGKKGIAIHALYDFWTPARHYQSYHGGARILSESASAKLATPITVSPGQIDGTALGYDPRERSWNYLEPWLGGEWGLRDIVDYQLVAMESCLYQAAVRREDLLRSFWRAGENAVHRTAPFAFVIPRQQRDPGATKVLLETLLFGMVEVERAREPFQADGKMYAAGSYVIRLRQPYGAFAKTLLERQAYPDLRLYPGGPPRRPYDVTAQTLPLLMGVQVDAIQRAFEARLESSEQIPSQPTLSAADTEAWRLVNKAWSSGGAVFRNPRTGDFSISAADGFQRLKRPRVGLYKSYVPSMDEGWTRWLLEQFGFAYTSLHNRDLQVGNLKQRFDVIVFPDQRAATIHNGHRPGAMPDEFTGGVGDSGAEALKRFAADGGTIVLLNDACEYALAHLGVQAKDAVKGVSNSDFYSPGSLLNNQIDPSHPIGLGVPRDIAIWSEGSPAFEAPAILGARTVAKYPPSNLLASGWLLGEKYLANRASLLDVPVGSGHVVLFGMRPQYRAQSYQTFKLFFNSLLYIQ